MMIVKDIRMAQAALLLSIALGIGALAIGCGDQPAATTSGAVGEGGADTTATTSSSSTTTSTTTSTGGEASIPPECVSPSGYQVCGGPHHCPYDSSACDFCLGPTHDAKEAWEAAGKLGLCWNDVSEAYAQEQKGVTIGCGYCRDGDVCIDYNDIGFAFTCAPMELAQLYIDNGAADRLRYADHSSWLGFPPLDPTDCPTIPDVPICGGKCGGCVSPDDLCTGRSPLHPYGLCVRSPEAAAQSACSPGGPAGPCASPDDGCFIWKVQPEHQDEASLIGYCLPLATCKAAADNLPGGGICWESP